MSRDDPQSQLRAIGKGVTQANLRLSKVLDRLEALEGGGTPLRGIPHEAEAPLAQPLQGGHHAAFHR